MKQYKVLSTIMGAALCAVLMISSLASCDNAIYDDLEACPRGLRVRFVYDYNMLYANAFPSQVDCVTLYIYDENGKFVRSYTETGDVLKDEEFRMTIDLPEGSYRLVAHGGLACPEASFSLVTPQTATRATGIESLQVRMNMDGTSSSKKLHDLFFGALDVTVEGDIYKNCTVHMMKDTNNIRIVLQQLNYEPVSNRDFTVSIDDDNTWLAHDNAVIPYQTITYKPWATGQATAGTVDVPMEDGTTQQKEVTVAYYELSTSRLMRGNSPHLYIRKTDETREEIVDIPLIDFLLLLKSQQYSDMGSQEFLDREYNWSMVFFLDDGNRWVRTHIKINDWIVRLNDAEL